MTANNPPVITRSEAALLEHEVISAASIQMAESLTVWPRPGEGARRRVLQRPGFIPFLFLPFTYVYTFYESVTQRQYSL